MNEELLETGLRGIAVGYCPTSKVDPEKGLFYCDEPISQMSSKSPEEVIYLLLMGREGSDSEVAAFSADLAKRALCPAKVIHAIEQLPREGHPMALFSAALLILGMFVETGDYERDCLNLIAQIPQVAATVINSHAGWGKTPASLPELGYMENFVQMLQAPDIRAEELLPVLRLYDVLHFDHGGGNLSTFVGKAVASGLEDLFGSISAAMCALAGPRHGRANQECLHFVQETLDALGKEATAVQVEQFLRDKLSKKELIYGFGHAVLRVEDPRATLQYELAQKKYGSHPLVKIALLLREAGANVLKENPKISNPYPNVDAISGTLLSAAGFAYPEYYTVLFGMSRSVGIAIQIVYERTIARGGKGTPIVRPKYIYRPRS